MLASVKDGKGGLCSLFKSFLMLGLYLYTLIIGPKFCSMYMKLIYLTKGIARIHVNYVYFGQKVKSQQQTKKANIKVLARAGN